jgi:hypothetical protein
MIRPHTIEDEENDLRHHSRLSIDLIYNVLGKEHKVNEVVTFITENEDEEIGTYVVNMRIEVGDQSFEKVVYLNYDTRPLSFFRMHRVKADCYIKSSVSHKFASDVKMPYYNDVTCTILNVIGHNGYY